MKRSFSVGSSLFLAGALVLAVAFTGNAGDISAAALEEATRGTRARKS